MGEFMRQLQDAAQELEPRWDEERDARLYRGTRQLGRRRALRRVAGGSLVAVCVLGLWLSGIGRQPVARSLLAPDAPIALVAPPTNVHTLRLADGSRAELAGARTDLEVVDNGSSRVALQLSAGRAHFEVVHNPRRSFVVEARPYRVEVIGTVFDVERSAHEVGVTVTRGKVRVYGPLGAEDLVAGQIKHFPVEVDAADRAAAPKQPGPFVEEDESASALEGAQHGAPARDSGREKPRKRAARDANWRSLSQSGQYEAAFASLQHGSTVDNDAAALMDAADAARLSGHPREAVRYLERVVRDHAQSPVAPLAAFTLGRVYLDQLGQPEAAATAFGRARALAPQGSLAQDALAREVEALSKGGNARQAYERAQHYLRVYPNGRRVHAVRLYGGVE